MQELKSTLIPLASLVTPNIPEAEVLANMPIHNEPDMYEACRVIKKLGAQAVLIKGGHLQGNPNDLYYDGQTFQLFRGERIETKMSMGQVAHCPQQLPPSWRKERKCRQRLMRPKIILQMRSPTALTLDKDTDRPITSIIYTSV